MDSGAEPVTLRTVFGWVVFAFVIAMIATPIEIWVGPTEHVLVVRLAGAVFAMAVIWRLMTAVRGAAEAGRPQASALAQKKPHEQVDADATLVRLAADVRASTRQWQYFVRSLWPRLEKLAHQRHVVLSPTMLPRHGRPVKVDELAAIVTAIEEAK